MGDGWRGGGFWEFKRFRELNGALMGMLMVDEMADIPTFRLWFFFDRGLGVAQEKLQVEIA